MDGFQLLAAKVKSFVVCVGNSSFKILSSSTVQLSCAGRLAKLAGQSRVQPGWPL